MTLLDSAKSIADAYFDELRDTAEIRQAYHDLIVANSATLFSAFSHDKDLKRRLKDALDLKTTDQSALLRGLFVQAVGVFDEFLRNLVATIIEKRVRKSQKYSNLGEALKNGFMSQSGRVLTHYGSGTVNGVRYDFGKLVSSLATCLSDADKYFLEPRVFTITMGNSTPERIKKIFSILGLQDPFSQELGEHAGLRKSVGETRKAQVAQLAEKRLAKLLDRRNDIAHGDLTTAISADEFRDSIDFLAAFIGALKELCERQE